MSFGMTWEQYWYGDVRMTRSFYEAHRLRKEQQNAALWIQGLYNYKAFVAATAPFLDLKGHDRPAYPEKPFDFYKQDKPQTRHDLKEQEEREVRLARAYMKQLDAVGKNWGRK